MTIADMAADLLRLEGEKIDVVPDVEDDGDDDDDGGKRKGCDKHRDRVLSDRHLDMLLDRSPEVFESRGLGWTSGADEIKKAAFAVYEAPKNQGTDALTAMMDEDAT